MHIYWKDNDDEIHKEEVAEVTSDRVVFPDGQWNPAELCYLTWRQAAAHVDDGEPHICDDTANYRYQGARGADIQFHRDDEGIHVFAYGSMNGSLVVKPKAGNHVILAHEKD